MLIGSPVITARNLTSLWIVDWAFVYAGHCEYLGNTNRISTIYFSLEPKTHRSKRSSLLVEKDTDYHKARMYLFVSIFNLNYKAAYHLAGSTLCYVAVHAQHTVDGRADRILY